jgi:hypothetical protein
MLVYMDNLTIWYDKIKYLLISLEETLNNSIESVWTLSSVTVRSYVSSINIYQWTMQWNYTWFITFNNSVNSFLKTYVSQQESMRKQIEISKSDREIMLKSIDSWELWTEISNQKITTSYDDRIKNLKSQIEIAENSLSNTKKSKEITIRSLDNSISEANISLSQARREYSKLTIKSPISWIIKDISVDFWQEVMNWSPMFSILNNRTPEIVVFFDKEEYNKVKLWDKVYIKSDEKSFSWEITSISSIADENLKYLSTVSFFENLNSMWELVDMSIPLKTDKLLFPINLVTVSKSSIWIVNILKDWEISDVKLELAGVYWDKIEIVKCVDLEEEVCKNLNIILNDVTNFDKEKFNVVVEQ